MTGVLIKRGNLDTETSMVGECHVNIKAEIRALPQQAKECQRLLANHHKLGEQTLPHRRINPAITSILDFWPPELRQYICAFNPLSLWHVAAAASGNPYQGAGSNGGPIG